MLIVHRKVLSSLVYYLFHRFGDHCTVQYCTRCTVLYEYVQVLFYIVRTSTRTYVRTLYRGSQSVIFCMYVGTNVRTRTALKYSTSNLAGTVVGGYPFSMQ